MQDAATSLSPRDEVDRRLVEQIRHRLGPLVNERLDDPQVIEIMLNDDGSLWEDRLGCGMTRIGTMKSVDASSFIASVASTLGTEVTKEKPLLEAELPIRGARFQAVIEPVSPAPAFSIRLKAVRVFTLADYVRDGIMADGQRRLIEDAASSRRNILIIGGTGGGKTTLANAVLLADAEATPEDRFLVIQDTLELQCEAQNVVYLRSNDNVSMRALVRAGMRLRPDRIIVGEVRGGEANDLIKAWNTGHDGGLSTLHANSARSALLRLQDLIAEALPGADKRRAIAEAVHLIIPIVKKDKGKSRKVLPILRVDGFHDDQYVLTELEP